MFLKIEWKIYPIVAKFIPTNVLTYPFVCPLRRVPFEVLAFRDF